MTRQFLLVSISFQQHLISDLNKNLCNLNKKSIIYLKQNIFYIIKLALALEVPNDIEYIHMYT